MAASEHRGRVPYWPALDGLRAVAVIAVLLFHSGFSWARGGYLGVTVFFTLSGFLITGLLLAERDATGAIDLRAFWRRRARRLVPGILVLFVVVAAYAGWALQHPPRSLVGDAVGAATWVANWRFIFSRQSYQAAAASPSPLQHVWSLAIEEQFYLVLPLLALAALGPRRARRGRARLGAIVVAGIVVSTLLCAYFASGGGATSRAYYGTDTRVAEPLVGVLLALLLIGSHGVRTFDGRVRWLIRAAGVAAAGGLLLLLARLDDHDLRLYHGGFLLTAVLTAVIVLAAVDGRTVLARVLAAPPLVAIGRISYGIYLFHWPIFLWLDRRHTGLEPVPLFALRAAVTLAFAAVSFRLVERPVRTGVIPGRIAVTGWATASTALIATIAAIVSVAPPSTFSLTAAGAHAALSAPPPPPPVATTVATTAPATTAPTAPPKASTSTTAPRVVTTAPAAKAVRSSSQSRAVPGEAVTVPATPAVPATAAPAAAVAKPPLRIVVMGDSMALGLGDALTTWAAGRSDVMVYNLAIGACALSRGTMRVLQTGDWPNPTVCYWWSDPQSERARNLAFFSPDVVFIQDAMNESVDWRLPQSSGTQHVGDPAFDDWLLSEYRTMTAVAAGPHATVVFGNAACFDTKSEQWVGFEFPDAQQRQSSLNTLYQRLSADGTRVLDLNQRLCPNGTFTQTLEGVDKARPDGYHLSDSAGLAVVTNWLGPQLLAAGGRSPG